MRLRSGSAALVGSGGRGGGFQGLATLLGGAGCETEIGFRIDRVPVQPDLEMDMRAVSPTGCADTADDLSGADCESAHEQATAG